MFFKKCKTIEKEKYLKIYIENGLEFSSDKKASDED